MFHKIKELVTKALGITSFATSEDGKSILTAEQRAKLVAEYGEKFTTKFETQLATEVVSANGSAEESLSSDAVAAAIASAPADVAALQATLSQKESEIMSLKDMVNVLSEQPETAPAAEGIQTVLERASGRAGERAFKVDMKAPLYTFANSFAQQGFMAGSAPTIDVADLKKEFGTYLSQGTKMDLYTQMFQGFDTAKYMTTKLAVTEWRASQGLISSVVQQFSSKWTPKGGMKFTPLVIKNRRHKINVSIIPDDIVGSWLMYLYDESLSPDKMPITRYIMQEYLLPKILEDIELRMIAKGKYKEGATDSLNNGDQGVPAEDGMDGFETILAEAKKVDGTDKSMGINFFDQTIDIKTCTDDQILNHVREFVSFIAPAFRRKNMPVFCSYEFYERYKWAYKNKWGAGSGTTDPNFGGDRIDFSTNILVPLASMYASPIIFATPKENFIKLRHQNEVPNIVNDIQRINYETRIFGEFWLGAGFAIGEAVFAAVPDGYDPYATIKACYGDNADWKGANAVITPPAGDASEGDPEGSL